MFSSQSRRSSTSQRFQLLVAHNKNSSDPSKGEAGNPQPIRRVFETQVVTTHIGTGLMGIVKEEKPITMKIIVNSLDFQNPNVAPNPIGIAFDEIQILGQGYLDIDRVTALQAGVHFGRGDGNGAVGAEADIAVDLAEALSDPKSGVYAQVDPQNATHVLVRSVGLIDTLFVKVFSLSYLLLGGTPPFLFEDADGNVLYDPTLTEGGAGTFLVRANGLNPMERS
jgi:hypothetical protein